MLTAFLLGSWVFGSLGIGLGSWLFKVTDGPNLKGGCFVLVG